MHNLEGKYLSECCNKVSKLLLLYGFFTGHGYCWIKRICRKNGCNVFFICDLGDLFYLDLTNDYNKSILSLAITAKATNNDVYALRGSAGESAWPYKLVNNLLRKIFL